MTYGPNDTLDTDVYYDPEYEARYIDRVYDEAFDYEPDPDLARDLALEREWEAEALDERDAEVAWRSGTAPLATWKDEYMERTYGGLR
jgi:hypothetical protein